MIILDTNVLSEVLRPRPDTEVLGWMARQQDVGTTAITVGELLVGVRGLPAGRRRDDLIGAIEQSLVAFRGSILPYDEGAARSYARMQERRRATGIPLAREDGMIAAICATRSLVLATRNTKDFRDLDLELVNPWDSGA